MYDAGYTGDVDGFANLRDFERRAVRRAPTLYSGLQKFKRGSKWRSMSARDRELVERMLREADYPLGPEDIRHINALYDGEVTFMDRYPYSRASSEPIALIVNTPALGLKSTLFW